MHRAPEVVERSGLAEGGWIPVDPGTLATGTVLLMIVGFTGALLPALRASRIDPIEAIRAE